MSPNAAAMDASPSDAFTSFANSFWSCDRQGLDSLQNYVEEAYHTMETLYTMYSERAQLEADFGQKLMNLSNKAPPSTKDSEDQKETKGVAAAIDTVHTELLKTAKSHIDLSRRLEQQVAGALQTWISEHRDAVTKWSIPLNECYQRRQTYIMQLLQVREKYHTEYRSAEGPHSSRLQSLQKEYKQLLAKVDEAVKQWNNEWLKACKQLETMEQERIEFFTNNTWEYANLGSARLLVQDEWCEKIRKKLEECDIGEELERQAREFGLGTDMPSTNDYVDFYIKQQKQHPQKLRKASPQPNDHRPRPIAADAHKSLPPRPTTTNDNRLHDAPNNPQPSTSTSSSSSSSSTAKRGPIKRKPLDRQMIGDLKSTVSSQRGAPLDANASSRSGPARSSLANLEDLLRKFEGPTTDHNSEPVHHRNSVQPPKPGTGIPQPPMHSALPSIPSAPESHHGDTGLPNIPTPSSSSASLSTMNEAIKPPKSPRPSSQQLASHVLQQQQQQHQHQQHSYQPHQQQQQQHPHQHHQQHSHQQMPPEQNATPGMMSDYNRPLPCSPAIQPQYGPQQDRLQQQSHPPASNQPIGNPMNMSMTSETPMMPPYTQAANGPAPSSMAASPMLTSTRAAPPSPIMIPSGASLAQARSPVAAPAALHSPSMYQAPPSPYMTPVPYGARDMRSTSAAGQPYQPPSQQAYPHSPMLIPTSPHGPQHQAYSRPASPMMGPASPSAYALPMYLPDGRPVATWARAKYDYVANDSTELTFKRGTLFALTSMSVDEGWWNAELWDEVRQCSCASGCIPGNYVVNV
ncbi:uncharacterized protein BYT42DRAFT_610310 [Radiomyces spectabilis]|uniref:uncharacterized protein n=1 Tax=Radiomyces spectabilis TaxID=64574 RepID=UPI00221FD609|nr:uncharacterized protein BYT42DRAFT_610310 [Radiomyces spectabilis]KAI8391046.1 hypothetical protein BYT42DRAFT_610310 [Radiomyces spectabilis]